MMKTSTKKNTNHTSRKRSNRKKKGTFRKMHNTRKRSNRKNERKIRKMHKNGGGSGCSRCNNPDDSSNCQYHDDALHALIISGVNADDRTHLKHLIETCNQNIVSILNMPIYDGNTALILASNRCSPEVVKILIDAGADVNLHNNTGDTALMRATVKKCPTVAGILIEAGADINAKNEDGMTAVKFNKLFKGFNLMDMRNKISDRDRKNFKKVQDDIKDKVVGVSNDQSRNTSAVEKVFFPNKQLETKIENFLGGKKGIKTHKN